MRIMFSTKLTISQHRYLMKIYKPRLVLVLKPKPHKSTISAIRRPEPRKIHEPNKKMCNIMWCNFENKFFCFSLFLFPSENERTRTAFSISRANYFKMHISLPWKWSPLKFLHVGAHTGWGFKTKTIFAIHSSSVGSGILHRAADISRDCTEAHNLNRIAQSQEKTHLHRLKEKFAAIFHCQLHNLLPI